MLRTATPQRWRRLGTEAPGSRWRAASIRSPGHRRTANLRSCAPPCRRWDHVRRSGYPDLLRRRYAAAYASISMSQPSSNIPVMMTVSAGWWLPRTSCRILRFSSAYLRDDRKIVTFVRFDTVICAAFNWARTFAHARRHCDSKSDGTAPFAETGICPLTYSRRSGRSTRTAWLYLPMAFGATSELMGVIFIQHPPGTGLNGESIVAPGSSSKIQYGRIMLIAW